MNSITPFFTIIVTSYNQLDLLKKTLESVFEQTYKDFELIIADDSSNDGTVDISLKKGGLVHIICNIAKGKISGSLRSIMTPKQLKKLCR